MRAGLDESIRRLRATCAAELESDVTTSLGEGATVTHRKVPVDRVGLYVPGGLAPLVSSVVMNVVPAQVAGVRSIALSSPPQKNRDGLPEPTIMAACALLGVDEVYAVGGAQAIAMFAYGAGPCRPVNLVTGPGNIYVAAAKRVLRGVVGIDSEAGPTEIAILADDTADASYVAADLISQAEHDPMAASVLVTDSLTLADDVDAELEKQVFATRHTAAGPDRADRPAVRDRAGRRRRAGPRRGQRLCGRAPRDPHPRCTRDRGAGAQRGRRSSSAPSRRSRSATTAPAPTTCCPTAGCACHSSGLSVRAFLKSVHVIDYSREALAEVADHVVTLAEAEDLPGHGAAVKVRFDPRDLSGDPT